MSFLRKLLGVVLFLISVLRPFNLFAEDTGVSGLNLEFFHPSIDPHGFFSVNGPRLLSPGEVYFKVSQSLAGDHLFQLGINGVPVDIVDKIFTTSFVGSLGVSSILTIGAEVPLHLYAREANFNTLAPFTTRGLGDIRLAVKFRLLEEGKRLPGLAFLFINSFPSGDESKFLGTSHTVPGFELIAGKDLDYASVAVNLGMTSPQQKTVLGQNFDGQLTYGGAIKIPFTFLDWHLSVLGEIRGHLEPNAVELVTAPVEFAVGLKKEFRNGLEVTAGGGEAWNNALGNPRIRGTLAVAYTFQVVGPSRKSGWRREEEEVRGVREKIRTTVYFEVGARGARQVRREFKEWIREAAALLKQNPKLSKVVVEGHTDRRGSPLLNKKLSLRRAEAVKKILIQEGIDPDRIEVRGLDGEQPIAPNETAEGRRLNRRVEILVKQ